MDQTFSSTNSKSQSPAPWWAHLTGALINAWVKIRREPDEVGDLYDPHIPICYVTERYGLSDRLILEQACQEAQLASSFLPLNFGNWHKKYAMFAMSRRHRWLFGNRSIRKHPYTLEQLIYACRENPELNVQLVPVSIFVGRAPDRDRGWFRVLFSENWEMVGRFRRLLALILNGRNTIVHFSAPISLRKVLEEENSPQHTVRKVARVLRAHFRRQRTAVIGPDLSHRRTMVSALLNTPSVRAAIDATAIKENLKLSQATAKARGYALEIAADYSYTVVRSLSFLLVGFWNRLYDGVRINHFDKLRAIAPGHEIIYVPCHRSHIDYLLLSYLLYTHGLVVPHIAAGVNLNLPLVGPLLRRGGAFFLRRSFKGNVLYSAVFSEYVGQLIRQGVSLEYFIEGGRSRTGRLLPPKVGMLAMTVRNFLQQPHRPIVFQPVYIGYEKLMEGNSYIGELSGKPKEKESLWGLLRALRIFGQRYGKVSVNFGEPIFLHSLLNSHVSEWKNLREEDHKPAWFNSTVDILAEKIHTQINAAADVNPINLLAIAILATPKHAMAENDLIAQLDLSKALLTHLPYSNRISITPLDAKSIIDYGIQMKVIRHIQHPLGDVLVSEGTQAVLLSYFRNNIQHLFVTAAWIACCFLNNRRMARTSIVRLGKMVYPFIKAELFLPWDTQEFASRIQSTIEFFLNRRMLHADAFGRVLNRSAGQTDAGFQLRRIAHSLLQTFERYYIVIAVLVRNGSSKLTAVDLETLCHLTAQRLSLLHELNAPEFFDKTLFRGFIQELKHQKIVWINNEGKLDFGDTLREVNKDARVILSREIRHSILKLTSQREN